MASNDYFTAAYPDTWQILGVQLRPFSLGHYFKLRRLSNAFVDDNPTNAALGDLLVGIVVCSMQSDPEIEKDEFWRWMQRPQSLRLKVRNALHKKAMEQWEYDIYRWGKRIGLTDFKAKAKLFLDYIQYHSQIPEFFEEKEDATVWSGAHWSQSILHSLVTKCGYSMTQAYNTSLRKCFSDFYKLLEAEGLGHIAPELERTK